MESPIFFSGKPGAFHNSINYTAHLHELPLRFAGADLHLLLLRLCLIVSCRGVVLQLQGVRCPQACTLDCDLQRKLLHVGWHELTAPLLQRLDCILDLC